ncbi:tyrosine-type recombinase/integrase [Methanolobus halotolerans]|nr:site-specific integrase [Methanolobus halotolerans]
MATWEDEPTNEELKKINQEKIDKLIEKIDNQNNREVLHNYVKYMLRKKFSFKTISDKIRVLEKLSNIVSKDFGDMTYDDMEDYIESDDFLLKKKGDVFEEISDGAQNNYKSVIQTFFLIFDNNFGKSKEDRRKIKKKDYPELVDFFEFVKVDDSIKQDDLLTDEEILAMLHAESGLDETGKKVREPNLRNQLLISMLYDSMGRRNEVLSLNENDIKQDKYGFYIKIRDETSKTFGRRVRLDLSVTYLKQLRIDFNSNRPLFLSNQGKRLGRSQCSVILKNAAEKAGITKRIFPHLFRHTKASKVARELPELVVKNLGGWQPNSTAFSRYIKISEIDADNAQLKQMGLITDEDIRDESPLKPVICPRCKIENPPEATGFCFACGFALDGKIPVETEMDIMEQKYENVLKRMEKLEARDNLRNEIEKLEKFEDDADVELEHYNGLKNAKKYSGKDATICMENSLKKHKLENKLESIDADSDLTLEEQQELYQQQKTEERKNIDDFINNSKYKGVFRLVEEDEDESLHTS